MLAKINRYHGRREPRIVLKYGRSEQSGPFRTKSLIGRHRGTFRAAVVVGLKVSKSAPVRSRIRRRVYETLRTSMPPIKEDIDLVVLVYDAKAATMPIAALRQELGTCLDRSRVR